MKGITRYGGLLAALAVTAMMAASAHAATAPTLIAENVAPATAKAVAEQVAAVETFAVAERNDLAPGLHSPVAVSVQTKPTTAKRCVATSKHTKVQGSIRQGFASTEQRMNARNT